MTRTPPCCCEPVNNCGFMFMRVKTLGKYPVFSTPSISLWHRSLAGYTGKDENGWFIRPDGLTGCCAAIQEIPGTGITFVSYKAVGIDPEYRIDKVKYLGKIQGDNINYYGKRFGESFTPESVVIGNIVLPERFKGISFNNSTEINNEIFYKFVKGKLPETVKLFYESSGPNIQSPCSVIGEMYHRDEPKVITLENGIFGFTAGTSSSNISFFKVEYANILYNDIVSEENMFYSLDSTAYIPPGFWLQDEDQTGGSPLVINGRCVNGGLIGCNSVPYAYFQTIPENIYVLGLGLAKCKDEHGKEFVSITDTYLVDVLNIRKVIIDGDVNCPQDIDCIEQLSDPDTFGTLVCRAWNGEWIGESPSGSSSTVCSPIKGIGKGWGYGEPDCVKASEVPCGGVSGPCEYEDCSLYQPENYVIEFLQIKKVYEFDVTACFDPETCGGGGCVHREYSTRVEPNPFRTERFFKQSEYEPYVNCGTKTGPDDVPCPGAYYKNYYEYDCFTVTIPQDKCKRVFVDEIVANMSYQRDWGIVPGGVPYDTGIVPLYVNTGPQSVYPALDPVIRTYGKRGDSFPLAACCCCKGNFEDPVPVREYCCLNGVCDEDQYSGNAILVSIPANVLYIPNPYLMYTGNPLYFNSKGIPNFGKFLKHYRNIWANDRIAKYPEAAGYQAYIKNPQCSGITALNFKNSYFLYNENIPVPGGQSFYDNVNCVARFKTLPNPDLFCSTGFGISGSYNTLGQFYCQLNRRHLKLENISSVIKQGILGVTYGTSECWKKIKKYWKTQEVLYNGLTIDMPIGLTLTDCTNILSWQFLTEIPKLPLS